MSRQTKFALSSFTVLAVVASSASALANCARPVSYASDVTTNTVTIQPYNWSKRACPDPTGMLRENVVTGELVKLADYCSNGDATQADQLPGYIDECVPKGKYRYGFASPYTCWPSSCSTDYYVEVEVTNNLENTCSRSVSNATPTTATKKPWNDSVGICSYRAGVGGDTGTGGTPSAGGTNSTTTTTSPNSTASVGGSLSAVSTVNTAGTSSNDVIAASNDVNHDASDSDGGCSFARRAGTGAVFTINTLALFLALMFKRRNHANSGKTC